MVQSLVAPEGEFNVDQVVSCSPGLLNENYETNKSRQLFSFKSFPVERSQTRAINGFKITLRFRIARG